MKRIKKAAVLVGIVLFSLLCVTPQVSAAKKPTLSKKSVTMLKGTTVKLTAKNFPGKVTWISSKKKIATVKGGKITAKGVGTATITAKSGKKKATCKVTVAKDPTLSAANLTLTVGSNATLKLNNLAKGLKVTWKSSKKKVATVKSGKVTAKAAGTATITATILKKKFTCKVTVKPVMVTSIKLNKKSATLKRYNAKLALSAEVSPSNAANKALKWSSSNSKVATVDDKGNVTAVGTGTATITAKAQDGSGVSASCSVDVDFDVAAVTGVVTALSPGTANADMMVTLRITNQSSENIFVDWLAEAEEIDAEENIVLVAEGYEAAWDKEYGDSSEDVDSASEGDEDDEDEDDEDEDDEDDEDDEEDNYDEDDEDGDDSTPASETPFIKIGKGETKEIVYRDYNPEGGHRAAAFTADSFLEVGIENSSNDTYTFMADLSVSSKLVCADEEEEDE